MVNLFSIVLILLAILTIAYDFKNHTKIRENKNFIAISLLALAYVASFQKEVQAPPYSSF